MVVDTAVDFDAKTENVVDYDAFCFNIDKKDRII